MELTKLVAASLVAAGAITTGAIAQTVDPRTPAGQLEACGGAANWRAVGYLEFEVKITTAGREQGPWHYRYDKKDGFLRLSGPWSEGPKLDAAIDLGSRTGGAWDSGTQLTGKKLSDAVSWALGRFGEDVLWLTFPLQWSAPGVTVTPLPDVAGAAGAKPSPSVEIKGPAGTWTVVLDPATGRVARTVVVRAGSPTVTVAWDDWRAVAGVYFANRRTIAETGETVDVSVLQALPGAPPDAF